MDEQRAFRTLTLLVAVCEQGLQELDLSEPDAEPLRYMLRMTHDEAIEVATSLRDRVAVSQH
jgi:hypothetical protein